MRKKSVDLMPVIHGGKSTSLVRGGTPPAPLILSLETALTDALSNLDQKIETIQELKTYLVEEILPNISNYHINYKDGIPQILNVSFPDIEAHILLEKLSERKIYISTQTACASESSYSVTVKRLTGSETYASTSVRISLSHLTTKKELDQFGKALKEILHENR